MFGSFLSSAVVFACAGLATAQLQGNAIRAPATGDYPEVGKPYRITWDADLGDKVSIALLRGEPTSLTKIADIATGIPNNGFFFWTPALTLQNDTLRYGLNLTVDGTNFHQYSMQFGIYNPASLNNNNNTQSSTSTSTSTSKSTTSASRTSASSTSLVSVTSIVSVTLSTIEPQSTPLGSETTADSTSTSATSRSTSALKVANATTVPTPKPSSDASRHTMRSTVALVVFLSALAFMFV